MTAARPYCYSQRMLNPFRGVMNVIEYGQADAVTTDGLHWSIYLRDEALQGMANDGDMEVEVLDIRFGTWSEKDGLRRAPLLTTMEYDAIQLVGEGFLEIVKEFAHRVPFPLRDHYELWLLDRYLDRPMALLASTCFASETRSIDEAIAWNPGRVCCDTFHSPVLGRNGRQTGALSHGQWLKAQINAAAGEQVEAQWFQRSQNGGGCGLGSVHDQSLHGRALGSNMFPRLLLSRDWPDSEFTQIVDDFLSWQAPWLLLLQHIDDDTRGWLEERACRQAERVAAQQRLYPSMVNEERIRTAMVEARLRRSSSVTGADTSSCNDGHAISGQYY